MRPRVSKERFLLMSEQEVFDELCLHLAEQKTPSRGLDGWVAYRGQCGRVSPGGHFIPDEAYDPRMETGLYPGRPEVGSTDFKELVMHFEAAHYLNARWGVIYLVERAHTYAEDAADLRERLLHVARSLKLCPAAAFQVQEWVKWPDPALKREHAARPRMWLP